MNKIPLDTLKIIFLVIFVVTIIVVIIVVVIIIIIIIIIIILFNESINLFMYLSIVLHSCACSYYTFDRMAHIYEFHK